VRLTTSIPVQSRSFLARARRSPIMTPHTAHEDTSESLSGSKVEEPVKVQQIQNVPSLMPSLCRLEVDTSAIDPNRLKRKIDFRLLPWLTLLYLLNFLDRGSIGNAHVRTLYTPTLFAFPQNFSTPHSCITWTRVSTSHITNILWRSRRFSFPMLYSR
jgi:hypothetical protein